MNERTVSLGQAVTGSETALPVRVQEALGELAGPAKEGLLAWINATGTNAVAALFSS